MPPELSEQEKAAMEQYVTRNFPNYAPRTQNEPGANPEQAWFRSGETAMSEKPPLNPFLVGRVIKSVKADHNVVITEQEVLDTYAGVPTVTFMEEIDQALSEYGFGSS